MAEPKIGRNEPCWCGSGRKYKKCHQGRDREEPINPFDLERRVAKYLDKRYCLHPASSPVTCTGPIVRAHTIQRNGGLTQIAEDGHVLGFDAGWSALSRNQGALDVKRVGVRDASTFTGFCNYHDTTTFVSLERTPFRGSQEQCFLLAYRAISRELFIKRAACESRVVIRTADAGRPEPLQRAYQRHVSLVEPGQEKGKEDTENLKQVLDRMLLRGDYASTRYYVIQIENPPDVMASFGFSPQWDLEGNRLQNLADLSVRPEALFVSAIAADSGGALVFSWIEESRKACSMLVRSLHSLDDSQLPDAVIRLIFEHSENTFFRPSWWNGLPKQKRDSLLRRISTAVSLYIPRSRDYLADDGMTYVSWRVMGRQTNLSG